MASNLTKGSRFYDIMKRTDSDLYDILCGILGLKIGDRDAEILYIQDPGAKKEGYCYIDRNDMKLYRCIKATSNTSNTAEYYKENTLKNPLEITWTDASSSVSYTINDSVQSILGKSSSWVAIISTEKYTQLFGTIDIYFSEDTQVFTDDEQKVRITVNKPCFYGNHISIKSGVAFGVPLTHGVADDVTIIFPYTRIEDKGSKWDIVLTAGDTNYKKPDLPSGYQVLSIQFSMSIIS